MTRTATPTKPKTTTTRPRSAATRKPKETTPVPEPTTETPVADAPPEDETGLILSDAAESNSVLARSLHSKAMLAQLRQMYGPDLNEIEWATYVQIMARTGLDPVQRQIYALKRGAGENKRMVVQTGIDGYRLIAQRTGRYNGQTSTIYGPRCTCTDETTRLGYPHPEWAEVGVYIKGAEHPTPARAHYHEYAVVGDAGQMWARMPRLMIGKCAEALALRKAFPNDYNGIYTEEEMAQSDNPTPPTSQTDGTTPPPATTTAAALPPRADGTQRSEGETFGPCPTADCPGVLVSATVSLPVNRDDPSAGKRPKQIVKCSTDVGRGKGCGLTPDWNPDFDRYRARARSEYGGTVVDATARTVDTPPSPPTSIPEGRSPRQEYAHVMLDNETRDAVLRIDGPSMSEPEAHALLDALPRNVPLGYVLHVGIEQRLPDGWLMAVGVEPPNAMGVVALEDAELRRVAILLWDFMHPVESTADVVPVSLPEADGDEIPFAVADADATASVRRVRGMWAW